MSPSPAPDIPPSAAPLPSADRLDLWRTFVRIVEAGSLTAAARQMNTTQPTLSRRLRQLEACTGRLLIQRSTRHLRPTQEGEACYERVKALIQDWEAFESGLGGPERDPGGTLRMVVPHAFGQEKLVAPLVAFLQEHPRLSVEWILHDDPRHFIAAGIDCALQVGEPQDPGLVAIRIAEVPRIAVASPSLLGAGPLPEGPQDLAALPWIALRTYYHSEVSLTHRETGVTERFPIRPRMSTDNLYALRTAALLGLGVCLGSAWIFQEDLAEGRLLEPMPAWRARPLPLNLVFPYAPTYPGRLRRFIEAMRTRLPPLLAPSI